MKGTQCLFNSRHALYRVFVSSSERTRIQLVARQPSPLPHVPAAYPLGLSSARAFVTGRRPPRKPRQSGVDDGEERTRYTTAEKIQQSGRSRPPQDHEITDPKIMVIDNGETEGPLSTRLVMSKLEPGESLRMIQPYKPATNESPVEFAVCKIVNKRDEYVRQQELKERKRADHQAGRTASKKLKEVDLTWIIGPNDLGTKLRQMSQFLQKGMKVEVVIARKKRTREASADEAANVLRKVREEIETQGFREAKPAEGEVGASMRLYLEGKQFS
ncbi:translation initiation factor IF-3 [Paramyrothecium foliicola]|nr:translation initiation factor IF-3 [Paramyrothecium foliicola]